MVGKRFAKNRAERPFFAISAAVPLGGRGAATPHKSFSPSGGKRKSGVWRDEVVKRSKNNRAKAIVIFTGATTGLFSEEEQ